MSKLLKPIKNFIFKARPIQFTLLAGFSTVLIITVALIITLTSKQNEKQLFALTDQLTAQTSKTVLEKTESFFTPIESISKLVERSANNSSVFPDQLNEFTQFAMTSVQSFSQIYSMYYGDVSGNFINIRKTANTFIVRIILNSPNNRSITEKTLDMDGNLLKIKTDIQSDYDPRKRPWYTSSLSESIGNWTNVYIFHSNKRPGITYSLPLLSKDKERLGVFGTDLQLGEISLFLNSQKQGSVSDLIVINNDSRVIAYPDVKKLMVEDGKSIRHLNLDELGYGPIQSHFDAFKENDTQKASFNSLGKTYNATFKRFPNKFNKPWTLVQIVDESKVMGSFSDKNRAVFLISIIILLISIYLTMQLSKSISKPMMALATEADKIRDMKLGKKANISSHIWEINHMNNSMDAMKTGLRAFEKYVPSKLVRKLIDEGVELKLGGKSQELTMFFSDIESFTSISENLEADALMQHLSLYLDKMAKIILKTNGTVDKYIGDAVMAFWGAPVTDKKHALHACTSALSCIRAISELNENWAKKGLPVFNTRIGLHTGETIVGNIGSSNRMNYTVLGDSVNLASRLEGINKNYGTNIIVSESTFQLTKASFFYRPLDLVAVKGKNESIKIYELMGSSDEKSYKKLSIEFTKVFNDFQKQNWTDSLDRLLELKTEFPSDNVITLYIKRCKNFIKKSPGPDWDGVNRLKSK
ncbi:hypothetical protein HOG98_06615 [bacterium]|jgi:adenylate cyclase|nr:hypothetical protein [bacterium]